MEHEYRPAEAGRISPELLFITVYKLDRYHFTLLFLPSALQRVATANSQFQFVGLPLWGRGFVNSAEMPTARRTVGPLGRRLARKALTVATPLG